MLCYVRCHSADIAVIVGGTSTVPQLLEGQVARQACDRADRRRVGQVEAAVLQNLAIELMRKHNSVVVADQIVVAGLEHCTVVQAATEATVAALTVASKLSAVAAVQRRTSSLAVAAVAEVALGVFVVEAAAATETGLGLEANKLTEAPAEHLQKHMLVVVELAAVAAVEVELEEHFVVEIGRASCRERV